MSKYLIVGGGGFIGGHLIKRLLDEGNEIRSADLKPLDLWFQNLIKLKFFS
jgi:Nucleoside-diphosphate-sugar epimerases